MTAPGYPKISYRVMDARTYIVRVQPGPRAALRAIGVVSRHGSLPSMRDWHARGNWPGAAPTRTRQQRSDAAADLWAEWQNRSPGRPAGPHPGSGRRRQP